MDIYLLRHGIAEDASPSGLDEDRRLTEEGTLKLRSCARALRNLGLAPDLVLASPYVRAQATAQVVLKEWKREGEIRTTEALVPHAAGEEILTEIQKTSAKAVLLVGHEPHLSRLASLLISGTDDLSITMKKSGCCKLSFIRGPGPGMATLEWLVSPRHFQAAQEDF